MVLILIKPVRWAKKPRINWREAREKHPWSKYLQRGCDFEVVANDYLSNDDEAKFSRKGLYKKQWFLHLLCKV